jgi:chromate reductase
MTKPEMLVARAHQKFDDNGTLTDDVTQKYLSKYLQALHDWITKFK